MKQDILAYIRSWTRVVGKTPSVEDIARDFHLHFERAEFFIAQLIECGYLPAIYEGGIPCCGVIG